MSENQKNKADESADIGEVSAQKAENTKSSADFKKASFGSLSPLTTAQIITLLVGTTSSNSSYGGY